MNKECRYSVQSLSTYRPSIGSRVLTHDGHEGVIVKKYIVTGRSEEYVHILEDDGRIWYCPSYCIEKVVG